MHLAARRRGSVSTFDLDRLNEALQGTMFHGGLHYFPVIDSTNTRALADAQAGMASDQVYIADEQTAGRGRGGHRWHSQPDCGLYLTALLRPPMCGENLLKLSLLAGIAAYAAIHEVTGVHIDLRWPNDLVSPPALGASRKLGGILTEAALTPDGDVRYAALGIGINLNQSAFPPELQETATSVRLVVGASLSREDVAAALLVQLEKELRRFPSEEGGAHGTLERFAALSSWVTGKRVRVDEDGGYTGETTGLTREGFLCVRCSDGRERTVRHGGVREI